ncbi:HugZ family pyridoxamine 5'-phosphate oxidase [Falsigemmobacter faecalis]|uniref:Pyridoxamine 5-phosphate oxidase n=1 Tax=Falsigemmobacter faecalis TaxID=2488730 RepID=A0A3P3DW81_9RHOB|nr:pyridoxamine 5-phosphate oxidase [Falsigemmobacter faecalis]RRH78523.1 pyridoxamine 5-phosphate oxidase [Falsigemmobacter faecalis]
MSKDPIRPTDPEARALAKALMSKARHGALAVTEAESGLPFCSRIALARDEDGVMLGFVSGLAQHTRALRANPACCPLIGEPGPRGDPLTHPRLSLQARAVFSETGHEARLSLWLRAHPKARIYAGLPDFRFLRFEPLAAFLNGGFGRAFRLTPGDLRP